MCAMKAGSNSFVVIHGVTSAISSLTWEVRHTALLKSRSTSRKQTTKRQKLSKGYDFVCHLYV